VRGVRSRRASGGRQRRAPRRRILDGPCPHGSDTAAAAAMRRSAHASGIAVLRPRSDGGADPAMVECRGHSLRIGGRSVKALMLVGTLLVGVSVASAAPYDGSEPMKCTIEAVFVCQDAAMCVRGTAQNGQPSDRRHGRRRQGPHQRFCLRPDRAHHLVRPRRRAADDPTARKSRPSVKRGASRSRRRRARCRVRCCHRSADSSCSAPARRPE